MLKRFLKKPASSLLPFAVFLIVYAFILYRFSENAAMLFAICTFQLLVLYGLIKEIGLYLKSRKGPFVIGEILEIRKVEDKEEPGKYSNVATIEFSWPKEDDKYTVEYSDKDEISTNKLFTISINRKDPSLSIVNNQFHILWWFGQVIWWGIFIVLSYIDYLRIIELMK